MRCVLHGHGDRLKCVETSTDHLKQFQEYVHDRYVHEEPHTTSMQDFERKRHEFLKHHFVSKEVHAESVQGFEN